VGDDFGNRIRLPDHQPEEGCPIREAVAKVSNLIRGSKQGIHRLHHNQIKGENRIQGGIRVVRHNLRTNRINRKLRGI
jgi:hypothetical protein